MSSAVISISDIRLPGTGSYPAGMVERIGPKRPYRLFIREWIEHRGLDQKRVAERMECEPGTVSKLISGKMKRTDEWLAAIAYALECDVPDLYRDPNAPTQEDLLRDLPPEDRERAIRILRALAGKAA